VIVWRRLADIVAAHGGAALVSVHAARGSTPREAGARMIVRPDGAFHGTIGGGGLEWQMLAESRAALREGRGPARFVDQALGPDLGQCCGGHVTVLVETFGAEDLAELEALASREGEGAFEVEAMLGEDGRVKRHPSTLEGEGQLAKGKQGEGAGQPRRRSPSPDPRSREGHPPPPGGRERGWRETYGDTFTPVLLFGAGHVGRALALSLAPLPFRLRWIDGRDDAFPAHIPANATPVRAPDLEPEVARAPADALVVVMTHDHGLDLAVTAAALRRGFPFVGLIGSDTKRARFERRLREAGLPEERIRALACPVGLPGIGGKEPAIIAASVAVQLLQERERLAGAAPLPLTEGEALRSAS
jgi:xanthine dehydrogenase accessory factor